MRFTAALMAVVVSVFAGTASAQTLQPASFSPAFENKLRNDLGEREGVYLRQLVHEQITEALAQRGLTQNGGARIEVSILDADPNRPTIEQSSRRTGLSTLGSVSIGGADLRSTLVSADGRVLAEVAHRHYSQNLDALTPYEPSTWTDARRAIHRFAEKVADACARLA